jgi:O-antigen/teichoic acid export membrane protein
LGVSEREAGRLILRGAYATAIGFAIRLGARLLFLFVASRFYGATAFGAYVLAIAMVELAVSVGNLGTKKLLFQFLESPGRDRRLPHVLLDCALLVTSASAALAAILIGAAWLLPSIAPLPGAALCLILAAPMVGGQALLDLFLAATRWKQAIGYEVVGRSIVEPYAAVIAAIGAYALGLGATGLVLGYWAGTLAALAYAIFGAHRILGGFALASYRPDRVLMRALFKSATTNTATDLLSAFYTRVDLYLVGMLLGETATGLYGIARQVAVPMRQIRQSFDGLLIPLVAKTLAARGSAGTGQALASATRLILAIQAPVIVALVAIGAPMLEWFGHGFSAAYWALIALAFAESIQAAFGIGDLMFVYLRPRMGFAITLVSIVLGTAAAFPLIAAFGITGAALSVLCVYGARAAIRATILQWKFHVSAAPWHHAGPLVAGALGCVVAGLIDVESVKMAALALGAGLATYAVVLTAWVVIAKEPIMLRGFHLGPPHPEPVDGSGSADEG